MNMKKGATKYDKKSIIESIDKLIDEGIDLGQMAQPGISAGLAGDVGIDMRYSWWKDKIIELIPIVQNYTPTDITIFKQGENMPIKINTTNEIMNIVFLFMFLFKINYYLKHLYF